MPPVDILSAFIKADYQRSLLLFTCLTLDLHATDAEPQLALLAAFYSVLDFRSSRRSSGRVFRKDFRKGLPEAFPVFRKGLPEAPPGLPEGSSGSTSGSSGRVFRKSFPASSSSLPRSSGRVFRVFRKGLPGLPEESSGSSGSSGGRLFFYL